MAPNPNESSMSIPAPLVVVAVAPLQAVEAVAPKRRRHHHQHGSLRILFYLLAVIVVSSALILFSALQRMTLDSTLFSLVNAMINAEFVPSEGLVDVSIPLHLGTVPIERVVLGTLYTQLLGNRGTVLMELLKGAHVVVENDAGVFYGLLKNISTTTYPRISSHVSVATQYAVPQGPLLDTLLTGTTLSNDSWFQFEGANWDPVERPVDSMLHVLNYVEYKIRGVQIGPLGTSEHTDRSPLRIRFEDTYHYHRLHTPGAAPVPHHV
ncbi:hypothetical protein ACHHYP_06918 [Achlya hypogyna]|uniref:Transmembrane protein n=1 Tax=Achlya hypogyna TaxID=1202772 RepID=A0A1V9ZMZ5_ACHHY|nr:hypothetical protein ACHHYP_06918 [Achlya hypogyna]